MHLHQVVIAYKEGDYTSKTACQVCAEQLRQRGVTVLTAPTGTYHNPYPVFLEATSEPIDLAVVLGGDGSVLAAARYLAPFGIPILPVKAGGHLGFLAQSAQVLQEDPWERIAADDFVWQSRMMLQAEIQEQVQLGQGDPVPGQGGSHRRRQSVSEVFYCLNEMCLKPTSKTRLPSAIMEIEVNGEILDQYHGDGVLVATPTGTTSYTVAANGPIIAPELDVITITPICPLSLSSRPIVIGGDVRVEIWPLSDPEGLTRLWTDGVAAQSVNPGQWVEIRQAPHMAKMVILERQLSYFRTLREKLQWAGSRIYIPTTNHRPDPMGSTSN
ncbi:MAG: NAD(+) kinase [Cyanobacteriota bacterium]|nr:NAD(+) kinase [Cyanobacteriota bacterium]